MTLPPSLFAYIDPGSGAILLQALLALLLTFGVFFRRVLFAPVRYFFPGGQDGCDKPSPEVSSPTLESASEKPDGTG